MEAIKKAFRPEFLNRLDGIIIFHALYQEQLKKITTLLINQVIARLREQEIEVEVSEAVKEKVMQAGYNPPFLGQDL